MISTIFRDESLIAAMVSTTCKTTVPPSTATVDAAFASVFACLALSEFCFTVLVNSSIDEAVSSSAPACCSVRDDKSILPVAISEDAVAMASVPWRISVHITSKLFAIVFMELINCLISSLPETSIRCVKSPAATDEVTRIASCKDPTIFLIKLSPMKATINKANNPIPPAIQSARSRIFFASSEPALQALNCKDDVHQVRKTPSSQMIGLSLSRCVPLRIYLHCLTLKLYL